MAKSFRIRTKEKGDRTVDIELFGDFYASSACELIHVLDESDGRATKLTIDTDGLRNINAFGLDVLLLRLSDLPPAGRISKSPVGSAVRFRNNVPKRTSVKTP